MFLLIRFVYPKEIAERSNDLPLRQFELSFALAVIPPFEHGGRGVRRWSSSCTIVRELRAYERFPG